MFPAASRCTFGAALLLLGACRDAPSDDQPRGSDAPGGSEPVLDTDGVVGADDIVSAAWIEQRVHAYGDVYVDHYLAASNRPDLCGAAQDAAASMHEAWDEFSRIYGDPYAYSYEELCFEIKEFSERFGEALHPFQSAGSEILSVEAFPADRQDPDDPPPAGTYAAVPVDELWDYEGPWVSADHLLYTVNPFATAAAGMRCLQDPYSWAEEFDAAASYTRWHYVEEGTLVLTRAGDTYTVDLEGTFEDLGDGGPTTVDVRYEAARCVVDIPNADVELFYPFW